MRPWIVPVVLSLAVLSGCGGDDSPAGAAVPETAAPAAAATTQAATPAATAGAAAAALRDWPLFGLRASRENATDRSTGITAKNLKKLRARKVRLPGTVDSSPIILGETAFVTTTYGKTVAVDLASGAVRWT